MSRRIRSFASAIASMALVSVLGSVAWASPEDELDTIDAAVADTVSRAQEIVARGTPGAYLTPDEAVTRFQDYLFLHLVGQHGPAAEGFFALVTTGSLADAGLHRDAEWYLAESLVGLGNVQTAAGRFRAIVEDPTHPFRSDAVRRLMELYALSGDTNAFRKLYDDEIVTGKVKSSGLITYSLAKSFYLQGDRASARSYFLQVPTDNEWFGRAQYFIGVMDVEDGKLDAATAQFVKVAALSIVSEDDRRVHDLAYLAQGRISYSKGDYAAAYTSYTTISNDSQYQDLKLYETVWTSIRREDWRDALNNVEIFLLAYPDHQYASQLRLLEGHLNFQQDLWPEALGAYEQVISDYEPIRDRFAILAGTNAESQAAVDAFLRAGATSPDLPEYALALMRSDPDMGRTLRAFSDLARQRDDIEESEGLIEELRAFVLGAGASSSYDRIVMDAYYFRTKLIGYHLSTLEIEERWSGEAGRSAKRRELESRWRSLDAIVTGGAVQLDEFERELASLRTDIENARLESSEADVRIGELEPAIRMSPPDQRATLEAELQQVRLTRSDADARVDDANRKISEIVVPQVVGTMPAGDIASLGTEVETLVREVSASRPSNKAGTPTATRIDAVNAAARASFGQIGDALASIQANSGSELTAVKLRFEEEVGNVARERADYEATTLRAQTVSTGVTRAGFGRLEDYFGGSVLKADMGIVDVYWAEKLETDDELVAIRKEKDAVMADLDRRFALIREKLGEGGGKK